MEGLLNLNKPTGPTSHDVVYQVRRLLRQRRVGHGGTLDPLAAGVLPIGVGRATRLLSFLQGSVKVYWAEIRLGVSTTTYDAMGAVTVEHSVPSLAVEDLAPVLQTFQGEIEQIPPPFSAIRQDGHHLYELARAGQEVNPPSRLVHIYRLELLSWAPPQLTIEVTCSSGTYIRSLAHDLGQRLGCGAHLTALVRQQVGPFRLEEAVTLEQLAEATAEGRVGDLLLPPDLAVQHLPLVHLDEAQAWQMVNGQQLGLPELHSAGQEWLRAYTSGGAFLGLLRWGPESGLWHPERVFPPDGKEDA